MGGSSHDEDDVPGREGVARDVATDGLGGHAEEVVTQIVVFVLLKEVRSTLQQEGGYSFIVHDSVITTVTIESDSVITMSD